MAPGDIPLWNISPHLEKISRRPDSVYGKGKTFVVPEPFAHPPPGNHPGYHARNGPLKVTEAEEGTLKHTQWGGIPTIPEHAGSEGHDGERGGFLPPPDLQGREGHGHPRKGGMNGASGIPAQGIRFGA